MSRCMFAAVLLAGAAFLALPAQAAPLTISVLPNPVPQSQSNPCIICGTNAAGQPNGFGYNNFTSSGNLTSFNMFSTNIFGNGGGGVLANNDQIDAVPYTGGFLRTFLQNAGDQTLTFGVAIDVNTASGGETLTAFQLIDLTTATVLFDFTGSKALPDIHNGNGKGDYLITGFDLSNVSISDNLIFRAQWSGASDGAESFYIVPILTNVPIPPAIALFGAGLVGLGLIRRRKNTSPLNVAAA